MKDCISLVKIPHVISVEVVGKCVFSETGEERRVGVVVEGRWQRGGAGGWGEGGEEQPLLCYTVPHRWAFGPTQCFTNTNNTAMKTLRHTLGAHKPVFVEEIHLEIELLGYWAHTLRKPINTTKVLPQKTGPSDTPTSGVHLASPLAGQAGCYQDFWLLPI